MGWILCQVAVYGYIWANSETFDGIWVSIARQCPNELALNYSATLLYLRTPSLSFTYENFAKYLQKISTDDFDFADRCRQEDDFSYRTALFVASFIEDRNYHINIRFQLITSHLMLSYCPYQCWQWKITPHRVPAYRPHLLQNERWHRGTTGFLFKSLHITKSLQPEPLLLVQMNSKVQATICYSFVLWNKPRH